jgi:hypothetical protein
LVSNTLAAALELPLDEHALHARVEQSKDTRSRVALGEPERERAPAAPKVEELHAVLDAGAAA